VCGVTNGDAKPHGQFAFEVRRQQQCGEHGLVGQFGKKDCKECDRGVLQHV
jgi:hypothetical protein